MWNTFFQGILYPEHSGSYPSNSRVIGDIEGIPWTFDKAGGFQHYCCGDAVRIHGPLFPPRGFPLLLHWFPGRASPWDLRVSGHRLDGPGGPASSRGHMTTSAAAGVGCPGFLAQPLTFSRSKPPTQCPRWHLFLGPGAKQVLSSGIFTLVSSFFLFFFAENSGDILESIQYHTCFWCWIFYSFTIIYASHWSRLGYSCLWKAWA